MPCERWSIGPDFMALGAGHVEHENGDDLWFSGGRLVIEEVPAVVAGGTSCSAGSRPI